MYILKITEKQEFLLQFPVVVSHIQDDSLCEMQKVDGNVCYRPYLPMVTVTFFGPILSLADSVTLILFCCL